MAAPTRLIAELGSNHNRDRRRALELVDACADAGAHAVKVQAFKIEDLFTAEVRAARPELEARRAWELPLDLLPALRDRCDARGLQLGATPFGLWVIEPLLQHVDFLKVASYELLWHDLIAACAATGKPLILSTGMATLDEVLAAVAVARAAGAQDLRLLHCVSGYPTPAGQANLAAIETLRDATGCPVGWSDHSVDAAVVRRAVGRWGASDVELHVDLDDGRGHEAGEHNWTPAHLRALSHALAHPEGDEAAAATPNPLDGTGEKVPQPVEEPDVAWRADPSDGLRPLLATRRRRTAAWVEREYGEEQWPRIRDLLAAAPADAPSRVIAGAVAAYAPDADQLTPVECVVDGRRVRLPPAAVTAAARALVVAAVLDRCRADTRLVLDLGAGWGRNLTSVWLQGGPRAATYVGAEYTQAGCEAIGHLAQRLPEMDLQARRFDLHAPDLGALRRDDGHAVVLTSHSIEQIPHVPPRLVDELAALAPAVTVVHLEPVGWQLDGEREGSSAAYAERHDYNRDLVAVLRGAEAEGRLAIELIQPDVVGANPENAGTLIVWSPTPR
jgi:sialic acid synthase SpsE